MQEKNQIKQICQQVEQLNYSEVNTRLLLYYVEKACFLAAQQENRHFHPGFLSSLRHIKDRQILPLLEQGLVAKEKRQRFFDTKTRLSNNLGQLL